MSLPQNVLRGVGAYHDPDFGKVTCLLQAVASGPTVTDRSNSAIGTLTKTGTVTLNSGGRWGMAGFAFPNSPSAENSVKSGQVSAVDLIGSGPWCVDGRFTLTQHAPVGNRQALWCLDGTGSPLGWSSTNGPHFAVFVAQTGVVRVGWWTGSAATPIETSATVALNTEFYLRVAHSGSTLTVQINSSVETFSCSPVRPSGAPFLSVGACGTDSLSWSSTVMRGTCWSLRITKGALRSNWLGHRNLPFPILKGTANTYVPGDGSGGPPPATDPLAPKGQWTTTTEQTWTVPADVTAVCVVCIGMKASIGGTPVCSAQPGAMVGDYTGAGGAGGDGGTWRELVPNPAYNPSGSGDAGFGGGGSEPQYIWEEGQYDGGGGGAGGYGAAGGNGGDISNRPLGAGAGGRNQGPSVNSGSAGQGASLLGISPGGGTLYGGGAYGNATVGQAGNALAAKNAIAVTPGQTITFQYISGSNTSRAARVMWGGSRSFPYAAANI